MDLKKRQSSVMECLFLRPLRQRHVFASSFGCFTMMKFVFGQTGLFNF